MRREHRRRLRNNNPQKFPYEPLVLGRRLVCQRSDKVHRAILNGNAITEDMRAIAAKRWPELIAKLPPAK